MISKDVVVVVAVGFREAVAWTIPLAVHILVLVDVPVGGRIQHSPFAPAQIEESSQPLGR
jgi:hypothetical protein